MTRREPDDPLIRQLADLRLQPRPDAEFRRLVWTRINERAAPANWVRYARTHTLTVGAALVVALLVGSLAGLDRARVQAAHDNQLLAKSYVRTLDPRVRMP